MKYMMISKILKNIIYTMIVTIVISCSSQNNNYEDNIKSVTYTQTRQITIQKVVTWYTTGDLDISILAPGFKFTSPFYKNENKNQFIKEFKEGDFYKTKVLAKVKKFDPFVLSQSTDGKYFVINAGIETIYSEKVYETILLHFNDKGIISEMRSIYDLQEMTKAFHLTS